MGPAACGSARASHAARSGESRQPPAAVDPCPAWPVHRNPAGDPGGVTVVSPTEIPVAGGPAGPACRGAVAVGVLVPRLPAPGSGTELAGPSRSSAPRRRVPWRVASTPACPDRAALAWVLVVGQDHGLADAGDHGRLPSVCCPLPAAAGTGKLGGSRGVLGPQLTALFTSAAI